jgi:hypothetical protein
MKLYYLQRQQQLRIYTLYSDLIRDQLKNPGVDGRIIFKMDLEEMGCGDMNWIELAQNRDRWRALVNAMMNLRVP